MQHEFISLCACLLYLFTYLLISTKAFNSETPKTWKKKKKNYHDSAKIRLELP